jgi:hypothetical protein
MLPSLHRLVTSRFFVVGMGSGLRAFVFASGTLQLGVLGHLDAEDCILSASGLPLIHCQHHAMNVDGASGPGDMECLWDVPVCAKGGGSSLASSAPHPTSVDSQHRAMDVVGGCRGEKYCRALEISRSAPPVSWNTCKDSSAAHGVITQSPRVVSRNVSWRDCVDVDTARSPLIGEGLSQLPNAALAA